MAGQREMGPTADGGVARSSGAGFGLAKLGVRHRRTGARTVIYIYIYIYDAAEPESVWSRPDSVADARPDLSLARSSPVRSWVVVLPPPIIGCMRLLY